MSIKAIVIANQTQARFMIWDDTRPPEENHPPLKEIRTITNPTALTSGKEVWTNLQPGRNRGAAAQAHGYDDHRQNHLDEFERRFCHAIATQGKEIIDQFNIRTLILAAPPHLLGCLRREIEVGWPTNLKVQELAKDLVKLSDTEIRKYFVTKALLPVAGPLV